MTLWATGSDASQDQVLRIAAIRRGRGGEWEGIDHLCSNGGQGSARIRKAFGLTGPDLAEAGSAASVWAELREFVGARPIVTVDGHLLEGWARALDRETSIDLLLPPILGIDGLAALTEPGQLVSMGPAALVGALVDRAVAPSPPGAILPPHLLAALAELVARFGDLGPAVHALCAYGWKAAHGALLGSDPPAAERLALAMALLDAPTDWGGGVDLFAAGRLKDGRLTEAALEDADEDDPLGLLTPAVTSELMRIETETILPPDTDEPAPFLDEDLALLDDIFKVHLPALFAPDSSTQARAELYRKSQHRVAEEVARSLGSDELLLVHAPTGTGKTLAYLLPALMWARRYGVRVGVATYTRALQSQAMEREVPRAFEALARAGFMGGFRVSILKGREASLCWRSLRVHAPAEGDDAETWLAWTALALFGIRDPDGDLDRFPRRSPVRLSSMDRYRSALFTLLNQARARSGCCTQGVDRSTCAADVARARAQRSHVVLTNQSFALARPEFFRRVVFDECEHLHDQAMGAWSHRVSFGVARRVMTRLHEPGGKAGRVTRQKPPLDRLAGVVLPGSDAHERLRAARTLWTMANTGLAELEGEVLKFEAWRTKEQIGRTDSEQYGLFREYVMASGLAEKLVNARLTATSAMKRLETALAQLVEDLESVPLRRRARIRRSLDLARADLAEVSEALEAWLPVDDGVPRFANSIFHDVERGPRDEVILAALVLLPGDALGKHYYPELGSAAFVSATTRIGGSFDKAKSYLGLDRVAQVDQETGDFDRSAGTRRVTSFHAPEVFDYGRVLVGVPRSVPSVRNREEYLTFLARYLTWFAERTRGRMLVLFTSLRDIREVAERCAKDFAAKGLPLFWQGMPAAGKEELTSLFRERVEATLFGVDTFWYGADFPGETLETLVLARLPYGVPDRYHHAQCAAIGIGAQRNRIYMPRALAKFRQGFGRLMRTATDRGIVLVLDNRVTERRHGEFMKELPVERPGAFDVTGKARLVRGDLDLVSREALAHLGLLTDLERRGLTPYFSGNAPRAVNPIPRAGRDLPLGAMFDETSGPIEINPDDLPY